VFGAPRNLRPRYNVAPTTNVDVIRLDREGRRELVSMRWGLIRFFWKKGSKEVPATFNARAETVAEKPMFRESFKRRRRCIIPASGFFEWTGEKGEKQPHLFSAADGSPILAFVGRWDSWIDPASKEEILSCTITIACRCYCERKISTPGSSTGRSVPTPIGRPPKARCANGQCRGV
jgi:putative SOS response-associated peptidase YedK